MRNIRLIFIYCVVYFISFAEGIGDLDITISLIPEIPTKKYSINNSILLDTGDINSENLGNKIEKKIATVLVKMNTKKSGEAKGIVDYCVIDGGDFTEHYKIKELKNLNGTEIRTNDLKIYHGNKNVILKLYQKNFNYKLITDAEIEPKDGKYVFSAYPKECIEKSSGEKGSVIQNLEYSFDIYVEIIGARAKDIVRTEVSVKNDQGNEEAVGALKDLVREQFNKIRAN